MGKGKQREQGHQSGKLDRAWGAQAKMDTAGKFKQNTIGKMGDMGSGDFEGSLVGFVMRSDVS